MEGNMEKKSPCMNVIKLDGKEIKMPGLNMDDINKQSNMVVSVSTTPQAASALKKSSSERRSCLCSPTTHVGSFRCRHHRSGMSHASSVGSNLSAMSSNDSLQSQY
ncbi:hypothetical protein GLYMA_14G011700v4 [Glycine max]|uniref:Uncharacterized protein n=2 Tax=Glycine max TaxID=3847 RepID=I1M6E2_SOYBN|nr:hypothetical protein GYH30_038690 [Glycine max]KRH14197.1 hypothetical protein GLYMA_14G011700v4 [Glycine max]